MSDFNSSLPVRTQANGDVVAFLADGTVASQLLAIDASGRLTIKLQDGNGNSVTSQSNGAQRALDVGINVAGVQIDPRVIRALTSADIVSVVQSTSPWITSDLAGGSVVGGAAGTKSMLAGAIYNSTLPTLTTGQQSSLQLDSSGRLLIGAIAAGSNTIGNVNIQASGTALTSTGSSLNVAVTAALPAGINIIGKVELTDGTNTQAVKAASTAAVATDPAAVVALSPNSPLPAGTNALGSVLANIQVANAAVSAINPVPVSLVSSTPGTAIQDYHTSASLASGSSITFTYTVIALHTFNLQRIWASGSGKIKVVVQNGASPIFVGFNSTATPNIDITVVSPPTIAAAGTVSVIITNEDKASFDVYATIEGNQN